MHKLIALSLLVTLASCAPTSPSPDAKSSALREVSTLNLPTAGGAARRLADFRGKVVMVHFFSSWCAECGTEAPSLRNLYSSFTDTPFSIVGIAVDDEPYNMLSFASKYQLPFPILIDTNSELKQFFGIKDIPTTLFLNREGVPISFVDPQTGMQTALITGARQWDTEQPVQLIASLIETNFNKK